VKIILVAGLRLNGAVYGVSQCPGNTSPGHGVPVFSATARGAARKVPVDRHVAGLDTVSARVSGREQVPYSAGLRAACGGVTGALPVC